MKRYGFVILHYGDIKVTEECIDTILRLDFIEQCIIVVVDNDSGKSESKSDKLSDKYTEKNYIKVIRTAGETGFSEANNYGYKYIVDNYNVDFMIITNNDIIFEQKDLLKRIEESYGNEEWDVLSPDVIGRETGVHQSPIAFRGRTYTELEYTIFFNRLCLILLPIIYPLLSRIMQGYKQRDYIDKKVDNVVPCGACLCLSKRFIDNEDKVFKPETKFYYEEYILHHRCALEGYNIVYDPTIRVIHGDGKATRTKAKDEKERLRFIMSNTLQSAIIYRNLKKQTDGDVDV